MITVADLITPLTIDEAKATIYNVLDVLGVSTTGWFVGSVVRFLVALVAICMVAVSTIYVAIGKGGFRSHATGDWLTLYAYDVAGVTRRLATFAPGEVTLSNTAGGVYNPDAREHVFQNLTTKQTYTNTAAFALGAGTLISPTVVTIPIEAIEAGSASTSGPGTITAIVTTMPGVACTNAASLVGLDEMTDDELRLLVDESLDAPSPNGPAGAYLAAAKTAVRVSDGSNVGVTRARTNDNSSTATVTVTVATASGAITGTAGDPSTDLGAVNLAIQTSCVPLGIASCTVQSASTVSVAVTYSVWYYTTSGLAAADMQAKILTALTTWFSTRPIGGDIIPPGSGYLYENLVEAAIKSASDYIFKVTITAPDSDVAISATQIPILGTVTPTLVQPVSP